MKRKLFFVAFLAAFLCFSCSDDNNNPDDGGGTDNPGGGTDNPGGGTDNPGGGNGERTFTITEKDIEMAPYDRVDIAIKDSKTDTYKFESSDTLVAKVIDNGTIVPGKDGKATIKVSTSDGKFSENVTVTVNPFIVEPIYMEGTTWEEIEQYESSVGRRCGNFNNPGDYSGYPVYAFFGKEDNIQFQYVINGRLLYTVTALAMTSSENHERYISAAENFLDSRYEFYDEHWDGSGSKIYYTPGGYVMLVQSSSGGTVQLQYSFDDPRGGF